MPESGTRLHDKSCNFILPTEKVRPLRNRLICEVLPVKLGELIEADFQGDAVRGRVIASGPDTYPRIHRRGTRDGKPWRAVTDARYFRPNEVKVGDIISCGGMEWGGYLWPRLLVDGKDCFICTEDDVAVIEG